MISRQLEKNSMNHLIWEWHQLPHHHLMTKKKQRKYHIRQSNQKHDEGAQFNQKEKHFLLIHIWKHKLLIATGPQEWSLCHTAESSLRFIRSASSSVCSYSGLCCLLNDQLSSVVPTCHQILAGADGFRATNEDHRWLLERRSFERGGLAAVPRATQARPFWHSLGWISWWLALFPGLLLLSPMAHVGLQTGSAVQPLATLAAVVAELPEVYRLLVIVAVLQGLVALVADVALKLLIICKEREHQRLAGLTPMVSEWVWMEESHFDRMPTKWACNA